MGDILLLTFLISPLSTNNKKLIMESEIPSLAKEQEQQLLLEILENTRKTKNYIKWQLIITVALVVIPLLAMGIILPIALKSLGSVYGSGGILEGIQ